MNTCLSLALLLTTATTALCAQAATLPEFDLTKATACSEWKPVNHIRTLRPVPDGLEITIDGEDPFAEGPPRDYPDGVPLFLVMRLKSEAGGTGQVFYFRDHADEGNSSHFSTKRGEWNEVRVMLPPLGKGYRLRIDPPGSRGVAIIASLRFEPAITLSPPEWPSPVEADFTRSTDFNSGELQLQVAEKGFRVSIGGTQLAASHTRSMLGYVHKDQVQWLDLGQPATVRKRGGEIQTRLVLRDADGARWTLSQHFAAGKSKGAIHLKVSVEVDQDRDVAFLPLLLLAAGQGSTNKGQAVFPGLEYIDNEPSSSEADLIGPQSRRQVPANHKLTFPLMAIQKDGRYVGIIWDHAPRFSAVFDSPDRLFGTGGHVMGVLFPGSDGDNRGEGNVMPFRAQRLSAGRTLEFSAQIIGGFGASVVPAIRQYVDLHGLPPVPPSGYSFREYVRFAAKGWTESKIREGNLYRHAIFGNNFKPQVSADAAMYMNWLSIHAGSEELQASLGQLSRDALAMVPVDRLDSSVIGHVRYPVQSLLFGGVPDSVEQHNHRARDILRRFRSNGTIAYKPNPGGVDYARSHFADHANGLSALALKDALEGALFSGDTGLVEEALEMADRMRGAYAQGVPRGAQTWEVPLHTPDILASAHLVRVFTMAYQLTRDRQYLEEALYWAWTGLPFLYLVNPVGTEDLPYGCVTVFGATAWKAPVWIGRPVQWCGLVYADALYRLVPYDRSGPWKQIADGITATGIRYSWPEEDTERQGLLPDGWEVVGPNPVNPPINPATVQANAANFYGKGPFYDCRVYGIGESRMIVHAPGEIVLSDAADGHMAFTVRGWPKEPYHVLINGVGRAPSVRIDGQLVPLSSPHLLQAEAGRVILKLSGQPKVEIVTGVATNQAAPSKGVTAGLTVRDGRLWRGDQPYRSIGVNYCDLFQDRIEHPEGERTLDGLRFLGQKRIPFVRFWAGGFWPSDWKLYFQNKTEWFRRMDQVIHTAESAGVGLIPSLFWRAETFPDLFDETLDAWADSDSKTRKFMATYTAEVVTRYRSSPAIWGWEFGNELNLTCDLPNWGEFFPQSMPQLEVGLEKTPANRMTYSIAESAWRAFAREVRKLDPHRFITTGNAAPRESSWHNAREGTWTLDGETQAREAFRWMNPNPMNVVSVHFYPKPSERPRWAGVEGTQEVLRRYKAFSEEIGSPLFVGEFCSAQHDSKEPVPMETFHREVEQLLEALIKTRVDLAAFWVFDYSPDRKDVGLIRRDNEYAWILDAIVVANRRVQGAR